MNKKRKKRRHKYREQRERCKNAQREEQETKAGEILSILCQTHNGVGYRIQGECHHGCTAVGDGNTSPTTKLYEFYHLLPTVRIFSPC